MGHSALYTSLLLSLMGWGVVDAVTDATEETIMLRNHPLPGVDYERDPAPAPHLVLVTNSGNGRPPVFQLDTVHMNMAEQFGVLGAIAGGRGQDNRRAAGQGSADTQRNAGNRRNAEGQRNQGNQRNPAGQRNQGSRRNPGSTTRSEQTDELHRFSWWRS